MSYGSLSVDHPTIDKTIGILVCHGAAINLQGFAMLLCRPEGINRGTSEQDQTRVCFSSTVGQNEDAHMSTVRAD